MSPGGDGSDPLDWGVLDEEVLGRIVVVSPHMDDAVLGAGHVLASFPGTTVVTVFAGPPPTYPDPPTEWDASGGFGAGDDVAALRRVEDGEALGLLDAVARWLDFADHQYLEPADRPSAAAVAAVLGPTLDQLDPTLVLLPMGIANPDHGTTHEAGLLVRAASLGAEAAPTWICYEDHGYKHIPGLLAYRVAHLFISGLWPTPCAVPVRRDAARKRTALLRYRSQLPPLRAQHALEELLDGGVEEQYWRIAPPPPGWEALIDLLPSPATPPSGPPEP